MKGVAALALLLVTLITGCASAGHRLAPKVIRQVAPGMTREQVQSLVGEATASESGPDGRRIDTYVYQLEQAAARDDLIIDPGHYRLAGTFLHRLLTVLYSESGVVERAKFSETQTPYYVAVEVLPNWTRRKWVGKEMTPEIIDSIKRGVTTAAEIELVLGEPTWLSLSVKGDEIHGWLYGQLVGRGTMETRWSILAVQYDDNKVVKELRFHTEPR